MYAQATFVYVVASSSSSSLYATRCPRPMMICDISVNIDLDECSFFSADLIMTQKTSSCRLVIVHRRFRKAHGLVPFLGKSDGTSALNHVSFHPICALGRTQPTSVPPLLSLTVSNVGKYTRKPFKRSLIFTSPSNFSFVTVTSSPTDCQRESQSTCETRTLSCGEKLLHEAPAQCAQRGCSVVNLKHCRV